MLLIFVVVVLGQLLETEYCSPNCQAFFTHLEHLLCKQVNIPGDLKFSLMRSETNIPLSGQEIELKEGN
jgi:hypothetical protein